MARRIFARLPQQRNLSATDRTPFSGEGCDGVHAEFQEVLPRLLQPLSDLMGAVRVDAETETDSHLVSLPHQPRCGIGSTQIIVFGGIVRIQKEYSLESIPWLPAQPTR